MTDYRWQRTEVENSYLLFVIGYWFEWIGFNLTFKKWLNDRRSKHLLCASESLNPKSLAQTVFELSVLAPTILFTKMICWYFIKAVAPGRAAIQNPKSNNPEPLNPKPRTVSNMSDDLIPETVPSGIG